jgi:hypothetical protein
MNVNVASQNQGVIAWTGGGTPVAVPIDLRHHVHFGFTFRVTADIAAAAVFEVKAAPPSAADPCLPDPFVSVEEVLTCQSLWGAQGGPKSQITIPVGVKKGSICSAALPCKPDAFIEMAAVSGDTAKVEVVVVLGGPK